MKSFISNMFSLIKVIIKAWEFYVSIELKSHQG